VCKTVRDQSKMSLPSYHYAIIDMSAVTAATDALSRYLGLFELCSQQFNFRNVPNKQ